MCLKKFLRVVKCVKIVNDVLRKIRDLIALKQVGDEVVANNMATPPTLYQLALDRASSDVARYALDPGLLLPGSVEMDLAISVSFIFLSIFSLFFQLFYFSLM